MFYNHRVGREFPCKPQNPQTTKERSYIVYCVKTLNASGKIPDTRKLKDKQQYVLQPVYQTMD